MGGGMERRVIRMKGEGGPEVLQEERSPLGDLAPGHVRVRVATSGVNRADLVQRLGRYPPPPGYPRDIPGLEFAGVVEALGEGCSRREPGDRVMGLVGGGGYAELLDVPEEETIRVPGGVDLEQAGAIPEVFMTAWDALFRQARLQAGEQVLIHAIGSGVGTAALQLVLAAGARPIGTSRTPEKVEKAGELGLVRGVVAQGDWEAAAGELAGESGVQVILDLVGASYLEANLGLLGRHGRWIIVGVPGGSRGELDLRRLMALRASIRGTVLRTRSSAEKVVLARAFEELVVPLFEEGRLRPVVDTILPAGEATRAHERMEDSLNFGKILLRW
jgi:NADPH:quinone reductase